MGGTVWKFLFSGECALGSERRAAGKCQKKKKKKEDYSFAQSLTDLGPLGELGGFSSLEDSLRIL